MKITFSSMLSTFVVHAPEGTLVSLSATPTEIGDGVYAVGDSGIVLVDEEYQTDTIYLSTEGEDYTVETGERICYPAEDIVVWGGNAPDRSPFKVSAKGGGGSGGDNTHYKGTTTTAISNGSTTNPITIDGESYTAVFGDIVVYNYTEFVFDGTKWSEFGRPFDTVPTSGSANAVTSDGIYTFVNPFRTWRNGTGTTSAMGGATSYNVASGTRSLAWGDVARATGVDAIAMGKAVTASGAESLALGLGTVASQPQMIAGGKYNQVHTNDLLEIGNGTTNDARSNIVEVNSTELNVNGDIQQNGVPIRATTMPTITASMLGKVVQYVGVSDSNYKQGWNYVAVSDGAAEPTYSWQALMDSVPTSGSNNPVTSDGIYKRTPWVRGGGGLGIVGGYNCTANRSHSLAYGANSQATNIAAIALGNGCNATQPNMLALGIYNSPRTGDLFNIGNGSAPSSRSNIVEVDSTSLNVNGDIKRDGVGIDDYTTTERKIGKWIDGSDLYQRTFEISDLAKNTWHASLLGTTGIDIVDLQGFVEWYKTSDDTLSARQTLSYFDNTDERNEVFVDSTGADLSAYFAYSGSSQKSNCKAVITIKYTKPSVQALNANLIPSDNPFNVSVMESSETPISNEEPTDEMR